MSMAESMQRVLLVSPLGRRYAEFGRVPSIGEEVTGLTHDSLDPSKVWKVVRVVHHHAGVEAATCDDENAAVVFYVATVFVTAAPLPGVTG